jgi:hypothetical protein
VDSDYCRDIESYLCRKNDGHLIRIVGPAFERVCDWADRGVPLKVALRGIDRYFERYYAKGPRRRPVRIEHCEADVLDLFDEWRRAVGVSAVREARGAYGGPAPGGDTGSAGHEDAAHDSDARRRGSLSAHLDRVVVRLEAVPRGVSADLDATLADTTRQLQTLRVAAKGLRGDARQAALDSLRVLDQALIGAARSSLTPSELDEIAAEADTELAPFRARMAPDAYSRAMDASIGRIIRDRARLPTVGFD